MLDTAVINAISQMPQITISELAHAQEHSLEMQLPFLQSMLSDFTLLPLAAGATSSEEVAKVLDTLWGGDETLIVISSDLSHYLPYATAQRADGKNVDSILKLHQPVEHDHACGGTPISGLIVLRHGNTILRHDCSICATLETLLANAIKWWVMLLLLSLRKRNMLTERRMLLPSIKRNAINGVKRA